jgi:hypothetical protein
LFPEFQSEQLLTFFFLIFGTDSQKPYLLIVALFYEIGITRGHLAVAAIARGAQVLLRTTRYFPEKLFDAEPGWLGPKDLKGFAAEPDCHSRWETIQQARNGGSMTPEIMTQLRRLSHS